MREDNFEDEELYEEYLYFEYKDKWELSKKQLKEQADEIERLNDIVNELEWKPINEYENPKYDWVLIKMFIKDDNFECIPRVAEKRFNHWYDANGYEIDEDLVEVKYFMDIQQIDKLQELKEEVGDIQ